MVTNENGKESFTPINNDDDDEWEHIITEDGGKEVSDPFNGDGEKVVYFALPNPRHQHRREPSRRSSKGPNGSGDPIVNRIREVCRIYHQNLYKQSTTRHYHRLNLMLTSA
ncbi:hypothetical protein KIN20_007333 [Parelaphostrongylus tenuis]|uniref:Uncharacterized protein n=1 Tax=Parelaphostrongylus tenuis TaxID=148309 RepID=A0AAD5M386_PARTN|nr:hypothetical protein KIN20_007333 [Parelaphostrongylus tenuis]